MRRFLAIVLGVALAGLGTSVLAARNSSGTYSLPATWNPVIAGTKITTTWANGTLGDVSTELTDSLSRSGKGAMLAPVRTPNGSETYPAFSFTNETGAGMYRVGAGDLGFSVAGAKVLDVTSAGLSFSAGYGVSAATANTGITVTGNRSAGDSGTDVTVKSTATRTAGKVLDVKNNATSVFYVGAVGGTTTVAATATNLSQYAYLTSNATEAAGTFTTPTGFSFPVDANGAYEFEVRIHWTENPADMSVQWTGPAAPTSVYIANFVGGSGGTGMVWSSLSAWGSISNMTSNSTNSFGVIHGQLLNGANAGTVAFQFKTSSAGQTVTIYKGGWMRWRRMDAPY